MKSKPRKLLISIIVFIVLGVISQFTIIGQTVTYSIMSVVISIIARDKQDITAQDEFQKAKIWKSYKRNGVYQLKRDLFYGKIEYTSLSKNNELFPPWGEPGKKPFTRYMSRDEKTHRNIDLNPESIYIYNQNPSQWEHIKGVVTKGTRLKLTQVVYEKSIDFQDFYYIAKVINGSFEGESVILNSISLGRYCEARSIDSEYLDEINK